MQVSVVDLRRKMPEILRALDRRETVTLLYRGKKKALLVPVEEKKNRQPVWKQPAFGMWKDRKDMKDVDQYIRLLRRTRTNVV